MVFHPSPIVRAIVLLCAGALSAEASSGRQLQSSGAQIRLPKSSTLTWMPGWDGFDEPLDFGSSKIFVKTKGHGKVLITFVLNRAEPSKLYQVGLTFFNLCSGEPPTMFGQFPLLACETVTRQGVTATVDVTEVGVVTTDANGNGTFSVVVEPVIPGTYLLELDARNGAGCALDGGGGTRPRTCNVDFQSPGPFGTATTLIVR
jgi:hypothetical protein